MNNKRTHQLSRVAFQLEMDFDTQDSWGIYNLLKDFKLFRKGRRRRIKNVFHRKGELLDLDVRIFDYHYLRGGGNSVRRFNQTVFFIQSKKLGLPQFWMKPENIFDKIGAYLGLQDIDFERHPKFSNNYLLKGDDEDYIRAVMNDKVLQYFSIHRNWSMEGLNYYLILYKPNELFPPKKIAHLYRQGMKVAQMLSEEQYI